jgi:hypothetical protein
VVQSAVIAGRHELPSTTPRSPGAIYRR